jgi:hypothetical protein
MTIDEMIAVLQAANKKKDIQYRAKRPGACWTDASSPCWDWSSYDFRVKPTPRDLWVNFYR